MGVIQVNESNFEDEVLKSGQTVLVDFWAPWCGPCQMVGPVVDAIAEEMQDIKVCKLNTDENQELALTYKVMSIPMLAVFKNGEIIDKLMGAQPKEVIKAMLNK